MAKITRGDVKAPNETHRGNRAHGTNTLQGGAPYKGAPNEAHKGNRAHGTSPLTGSRRATETPNDKYRFKVEDATIGMEEPMTLQDRFGRGAVEVNPGYPGVSNPFGGNITPAHMLRSDMAKGAKGR